MPPCEAETSSEDTSTEGIASIARLRREHHRVDLQVGVGLLRAGVDLDQALEARPALAGGGAAPVHVASRRPGLVQVDREDVEVLAAPRRRRRRGRPCRRRPRRPRARGAGGRDGRRAAPAASGSRRRARPARSAWRRRRPRCPSPSPGPARGGSARRPAGRARRRPRAGPGARRRCVRLGPEVLGEVVLVHLEVAHRRADDERAPVLGDARAARSRRRSRTGPRRRRPSGTYRKTPPVQKAALAASSLWRSIGRRLEYQGSRAARGDARRPPPASRGSRPARPAPGRARRATTAPALCTIRPARGRSGIVRVTTSGTSRSSMHARAEGVEVERLQARRPEARAAPHGQLGRLEGFQRALAQLRERAPVAGAGAVERRVERRLAVAARP